MRGWLDALQKLKRRANRAGRRAGVSMAIVICIGALLLAFSLAMAYTGSLMMATANTRLEEERTYQLAKSFSEVLGAELAKGGEVSLESSYNASQCTNIGSSTYILKDSECSKFYAFAKRMISSSVFKDYASKDRTNTVYEYIMQTPEGWPEQYGSVTMKLYKDVIDNQSNPVLLSGSTGSSGVTGTQYVTELQECELKERNRYDFVVEVTVAYGDSEYTYKTRYNCWERSKLKLYYITKDAEGKDVENRLYYKSTGDASTSGEDYYIYTNSSYSNLYTGTEQIYYTYLTDSSSIISCTFKQELAEN